MRFYQNKKSIVKDFLVGILILLGGFIIVTTFLVQVLNAAEKKTAEAACKFSVISREKSYKEIREPLTPFEFKVGSVATPLFCKTIDKFIPKNDDASAEDVKRELACSMASCWNQFGEGYIKDVFKQGDPVNQNCFVCYTSNLKGTSKFKSKISATDFRRYMFENAYKASPQGDNCKIDGGFCIDTERREDCFGQIQADQSYITIDKKNSVCKQKGKSSCCYTGYECWDIGGTCKSVNPDPNNYNEYNKCAQDNERTCPSGMKCFVKKENMYSYGDYIQSYGGQGSFMILSDIEPGETYAISFGSPTGNCEWCTGAGIATGVVTSVVAIAAGAPTGGIGTLFVPVLVYGGAGYVVGKGLTEKTAEKVDLKKLFQRDINTVYFTTLNHIQEQNLCTLVQDIREK